jgi:hypothetical protein
LITTQQETDELAGLIQLHIQEGIDPAFAGAFAVMALMAAHPEMSVAEVNATIRLAEQRHDAGTGTPVYAADEQ